MCINRKEIVAIEGTRTWEGQGPRIFRELGDAEYTRIEVYGVDVEAADARKQALDRWWEGRFAWMNGTDQLGGRFAPADAIDICYPAAGQSICNAHALQFVDTAQSGETPVSEGEPTATHVDSHPLGGLPASPRVSSRRRTRRDTGDLSVIGVAVKGITSVG